MAWWVLLVLMLRTGTAPQSVGLFIRGARSKLSERRSGGAPLPSA